MPPTRSVLILRVLVASAALVASACSNSGSESSQASTEADVSIVTQATPRDACATAPRDLQSARNGDSEPFRTSAVVLLDLRQSLEADDEFRPLVQTTEALRSAFVYLGGNEPDPRSPVLAWGSVALIRHQATGFAVDGCADAADEAAALLATAAVPATVDDLAASCRTALLDGESVVPNDIFERDSLGMFAMTAAGVAFQVWLGALEESVYATATSGGVPAGDLLSVRTALTATTDAFIRWDIALAASIRGGSTVDPDEAERAVFEQLAILERSLDEANVNCLA